MTTIVHVVRHGEVHNPARILYGRLADYHLSLRGQAMAAAVAHSFDGHDIVSVTASPLERAQETAAPIANRLGLQVGTDPRLIEAGNSLEGLRIKGWRSQLWNPALWPRLRNPLTPSWGEPYTHIADRMWAAVEDARAAAEGHEAVLVSHQLPIVMLQRRIAGKPLPHNPATRQCELASVTSIVFDGNGVFTHYSQPAAHLYEK